MTALIYFRALDDRGEEILDELARLAGHGGAREDDGRRVFFAGSADALADSLDTMLDSIDAGWREHVKRDTPGPPED